MIGLDHDLQRWVVHHRGEPFDTLFEALSLAGSFGLVWLGLAVVLALLWRRPGVLARVAVAALAADVVSRLLKERIGRERPPLRHPDPEPLVHVPGSTSFPSGHATVAFACAAVLARAAPRLALPLYALAALVAWSRVHVGVHYPLDVAAGGALGLALVTGLRWLATARRRSGRRPRRG